MQFCKKCGAELSTLSQNSKLCGACWETRQHRFEMLGCLFWTIVVIGACWVAWLGIQWLYDASSAARRGKSSSEVQLTIAACLLIAAAISALVGAPLDKDNPAHDPLIMIAGFLAALGATFVLTGVLSGLGV